MKNLLISQLIVSLIEPPLKRFLMFFCLAADDFFIMMEQEVVMDPIVSHFEIFACTLLVTTLAVSVVVTTSCGH